MGNHNLLINNPSNAPRELEERNLLFMEDGGDAYLPKLFKRILALSTDCQLLFIRGYQGLSRIRHIWGERRESILSLVL